MSQIRRTTALKRGTPLKRTPMKSGEKPLKRTVPVRKVSRKRQAENRARRAMVRDLFPARPACAVPWCTRLADDVHEPLTRARGGSITDPNNAEPLCRAHHDEITFVEPAWAYELKLLIHSWEARR